MSSPKFRFLEPTAKIAWARSPSPPPRRSSPAGAPLLQQLFESSGCPPPPFGPSTTTLLPIGDSAKIYIVDIVVNNAETKTTSQTPTVKFGWPFTDFTIRLRLLRNLQSNIFAKLKIARNLLSQSPNNRTPEEQPVP